MSTPPSVTVRVPGLSRLRRDLVALGAGMADDVKAAHARAAAIVAAAAAGRAPRRTGRLAGSVRGSGSSRATVRAGGSAVPYAGPIHYGWPGRKIAPHPFLTDAALATEPLWLPAYEQEIRTAVEKLAGRTY